MRVRPGFLLGLLVIFAIVGWLVVSGVPTEKDKKKAKILETMSEERLLAELLTEQAGKPGGITKFANEFNAASLRNTNRFQHSIDGRTNSAGQLIDAWQTPFQIKVEGPTDFMISSAGPNLKFGDEDDIVFNSASNGFVKP